MNVTPAERRGFRAKTTSRTPLSRGSSSCLCSSSPSLYSSRLPFSRLSRTVVHLTHDSSLRSALRGAFSPLVVPLSVLHKRNDVDDYLPLHVAPAWWSTERKKKVGRESLKSTR